MKKYLFVLLFVFSAFSSSAQADLQTALDKFPYQSVNDVKQTLSAMGSWSKSDWKQFFELLDVAATQVKPTYALDAFVHAAAAAPEKKPTAVSALMLGFKAVKSVYAKELIIQYMGALNDEAFIKPLSKLLMDAQYVSPAARALATMRSDAARQALSLALTKSGEPQRKHIQAAIDNANFVLPVMKSALQATKTVVANPVQFLLDLQDRMTAAKDPVEKSRILATSASIPGFTTLMFVGRQLEDSNLNKQAALIAARMALKENTLRGPAVRGVLEKALPLIKGVDSAILVKKVKAHLETMPYDHGFVSLFNGRDLSGWKGLVGNPVTRSKMTEQELLQAQAAANMDMRNDWKVEDGLLIFTGHGNNLCTEKQYGDFEMFVDWKITEKGDAGIYLRGSPQVQIWDTSRREVGAQVGSGGLYNNQKNPSKPSLVADNKIGEWNHFHIIMKGEKVTVYLNGKLVVDNVTLENYWDRKIPIFTKEQIELQAHGTYVAYRNIYVREIPGDLTSTLTEEEKKQGFEVLFDGTSLDKWIGNKTGYLVSEGTIVVNPAGGSGGNLYTADQFDDFEFRFEFQLTPGANNGLGIRTPTKGDAAYEGMELQILDNDSPIYKDIQPYQFHGSVYGVIPAKRGYLKPAGEWNEQTVIAKGSRIKVILNGQVIVDGDIKAASKNGTVDKRDHPGLLNPKGHIGFLGHGNVVRFRNIRIKKLGK